MPQSEFIDANLVLGWFESETPQNPLDDENAIFIKSAGAANGMMRANISKVPVTLHSSLQNIPLYVLIMLRQSGSLYYTATFPSAPGMVSAPRLQPLAINPLAHETQLYGGFFQSVLGEIGFRVDTRVYETQITLLDEYNQWYGTAHVADSLLGVESINFWSAEKGGEWNAHNGNLLRTETGIKTRDPIALATLVPDTPSGLIHAFVKYLDTAQGKTGLVWRYRDAHHYFAVLISKSSCELRIMKNGKLECKFTGIDPEIKPDVEYSLQIVDRGTSFQIIFNGILLFDEIFESDYLKMETGVGVCMEKNDFNWFIHAFEAHPRSIEIPNITDTAFPQIKTGHETIDFDDFLEKSGLLEGSTTKVRRKIWKKVLGEGKFNINDGRCDIDASITKPFPGRTAYVIDWDFPDFADINTVIHPPGKVRGEGERCRAGIIFYQDFNNYIIVNTWLDDFMDGASISSFFQINGFEDIYDAVWTNVGHRISFGVPYKLRVTFDGMIYVAYVNDEPVLYRSLQDVYPSMKPLRIKKVGLVANWEWGDDTGSAFLHFEARN